MEILLLLTVVTLSIGAESSLPNVSYVKAIDIWMLVCLFNICATLAVIGIGSKILKVLLTLLVLIRNLIIGADTDSIHNNHNIA